jgi:hypothetical protein
VSKSSPDNFQQDTVDRSQQSNSQFRQTQDSPTGNKSILQALTSAALVLPGLLVSQADAADSSSGSVNFQYSRYQEGKRDLYSVRSDLNPIMVDTLHGNGIFYLTDRLKFSFGYTQDTWSGATPVSSVPFASSAGNSPFTRTLPTGEVVSGASPLVTGTVLLDRNLQPVRFDTAGNPLIDPRTVLVLSSASPETRGQGDFRLGYEWDDATLNLGGGLSQENDYESVYGNASGRFDFNQKLTSVKWGAGYTSSKTSAILDHDTLGYVTNLAYIDQIKFRDNLRILQGDRHDWTSSLGLTQILNKNTLVDFNFGYTHSSGFMENPYKAVTVLFVDPDTVNPDPNVPIFANVRAVIEQRPDLRNQFAFGGKLVHYINPVDAALHIGYKFSLDDWGINSNTFEGDWVQPLGNGWTITPRIRYYSQNSADFYFPYLVSNQAFTKIVVDDNGEFQVMTYDPKKLPKDMSSDHRLSGYGSLSGGVTINKTFARGVALEAGFEYYTRASALKLGGSGNSSFADFDYYVANAALKIDMDAINFSQSKSKHQHSEHHHEQHQHGGHHIPAGVMFGHMLDKAGDVMVGYRFMYSRQSGNMLHGARKTSDLDIVNLACSDIQLCKFTHTYMDMRMHMLDIMYAPTRWINLMLMPQFMDMEMNLRELEGRPPPAPGDHEHAGTPHSTGGVGDTIMMSLIKLLDLPGHRLHMGLGISAPTGDVDLKLRRIAKSEGGFIHFDMQLGSGTWDFLPNLTYAGTSNRWHWGAQLYGVKRMESQNESGYRLGDIFQASTWGGFHLTDWLSASVRGVFSSRGRIHGDFNTYNARIGPMDFPANHGGQFWDIGFGLSAAVPGGKFAGNHFAFEWLQPIRDDVNGYQLERKGALSATWHYSF